MSYENYNLTEVHGRFREMIAEKLGVGIDADIKVGVLDTSTSCGEGTCWNEWQEFIIQVNGETVYFSDITGEHELGVFNALQTWLEEK